MKLGPVVAIVLGCLGGLSCGYRAAYGGSGALTKLSVVSGTNRAPRFGVAEAVLHGFRSELGRAGRLGAGSSYPRVVVEVLGVVESSRGVVLTEDSVTGELPLGRASGVAVRARAWIEGGAEGPADRETGIMQRTVVVATPQPGRAGEAFQAALETAGREVGRAMARRLLGEPVGSLEPY